MLRKPIRLFLFRFFSSGLLVATFQICQCHWTKLPWSQLQMFHKLRLVTIFQELFKISISLSNSALLPQIITANKLTVITIVAVENITIRYLSTTRDTNFHSYLFCCSSCINSSKLLDRDDALKLFWTDSEDENAGFPILATAWGMHLSDDLINDVVIWQWLVRTSSMHTKRGSLFKTSHRTQEGAGLYEIRLMWMMIMVAMTDAPTMIIMDRKKDPAFRENKFKGYFIHYWFPYQIQIQIQENILNNTQNTE